MGKQNGEDTGDSTKPFSRFTAGVLEVRERENGAQGLSEGMTAEKFTDLIKAQEVL